MEPITTVSAAITAARHLASLVKGVADSLKASGKSEALEQVTELRLATLDLLEKQQSLVLENGELKDRIQNLARQLGLVRDLRFDGTVYWLQLEDGKKDGPFCPTCFDRDGKQVRLQPGQRYFAGSPWYCLVCKSALTSKG